jgi:alkaline phosphatase
MRPRSLAGKQTVLLAVFCLALVLAGPAFAKENAKNVILLIPDGCSFEQYTFARWFKDAPLALDAILTGAVRTHIADSVVADSAPAGTAYSTGVRTVDKAIGVGPKKEGLLPGVSSPDEDYKPVATVLEAAKLSGRSTGIVSTSRITHATPAGFVAHVTHRKLEDDIMEQAVYQDLDLAFGGGGRHLVPEAAGENIYGETRSSDPHEKAYEGKGKRPDKENLMAVLKGRGCQIAATKEEMLALKSGKVFGMFAGSHMAPEIDRPGTNPEQPALAEMSRKAIEILSKNPKGFFLMIEGSQVDWACHANDPAHLMSDFLAYDAAVAEALAFAKTNPDTLVISVPDHNTGGFSIGNFSTSANYSQMKPDALLAPVKAMKASSERLVKIVGDTKTPENVIKVVKEYWALDITSGEAAKILELMDVYKEDPNYAFGEVICPKHTLLGWSTHGHAGGDVPLSAYGPGKPVGLLDAPEIGQCIAKAMGVDLAKTTKRLFVDLAAALPKAKVSVDTTDAANPVAVVELKGKTARIPANKDILKTEDKTVQLEGISVYIAETGKFYVCQEAVDMLMK